MPARLMDFHEEAARLDIRFDKEDQQLVHSLVMMAFRTTDGRVGNSEQGAGNQLAKSTAKKAGPEGPASPDRITNL